MACQHRWMLPTKATDSVYRSKCQLCGAKRTFPTEPKTAQGRNYWGRRPLE